MGMNGKLIVFEGVEGSGKSTQLQRLQQQLQINPAFLALQQQGLIRNILVTREPGGSALGQQLRQLLLDTSTAIAPEAELLLYAADRAQHVAEVIRPALEQGDWVLCDRYTDSTIAYQGYGRNLDLGIIDQLNQIATGQLTPDLTLWLQLEVSVGLARTRQRGAADRMEQANLAFHQRVQTGFETLARTEPARIVPIKASGSPDQVCQAIQAVINQHLQAWYQPCLPA